jgi:hypothetical protein
MVKQFLVPEDREVRVARLDFLQRYASTLSDVSGRSCYEIIYKGEQNHLGDTTMNTKETV